MRIGVDYYPEHWDPALWEKDADLMRETGVRLVRLAEFAWSRLEPEEGQFHFEWLDEVIRLMADRGIGVVLCTPTSCPPRWFYEKYPDAVMTERDGRPTRIGIRGHRCINHPALRQYAQRMIDRMAARYAGRKEIEAWQIDNELEAYFCCCGRCTERFRQWLREKYGSTEQLNRAYGSAVWSGDYSSWSQIEPPPGNYPDAWLNPAYMLDYSRFASDNVIDFINWQAGLLREKCPGVPITTNVWFCEHMPDFYREFGNLDFISYDNYPPTRLPEDSEACYSHAFHLDLMRGVKRQNFWVMEELSGGPGCWAPMSRMPEPGMIRGYSLQAFAHGADTVVHFRWRTAATGAEMHWHGLIDHSNVPGRRFEEFRELCRTAEELLPLQGSEIRADTAILLSFENEYAFRIQPQTREYYYLEQPQRLHRAFTGLGVNVDIISEQADFSAYRVVCAPEMYIACPGVSERLRAFARDGGTVILTTRSGVKDEHNNAVMEPLPGAYREMTGVCVTEYNPIGEDTVPVVFRDGETVNAKQWCDILEPEGAETIASYAGEYFRGTAAITRNRCGAGTVYYLATVGEQALYNRIAREAARDAGLSVIENLPAGVEVTTRCRKNLTVRFVFNNTVRPLECAVDGQQLRLQPFETVILQEP